jgi:hypothetical protein
MLGPIGQGVAVRLDGQPETAEATAANPILNHQIATPGYFEAMRIPLPAGRVFTDRDTRAAPRVAIVAESTARRLWPGQDPIGKRLSMSSFTPGPRTMWRTVVGVVSDVRYRGIDKVQLDVYDAALQTGRPADNVVVRTSIDPLALADGIRSAARELDSGSIVDNVTTLDAVVTRAEAPWRLTMWMFVLFAALAFGLAALGLFSLVAIDVSHRGREFAIRMALGASRPAILRGVLVRGGWRVAAGVALGLLTAVAASRAMRSLLFSIAPDDPVTYAVVLAVVAVAVALAAYIPAPCRPRRSADAAAAGLELPVAWLLPSGGRSLDGLDRQWIVDMRKRQFPISNSQLSNGARPYPPGERRCNQPVATTLLRRVDSCALEVGSWESTKSQRLVQPTGTSSAASRFWNSASSVGWLRTARGECFFSAQKAATRPTASPMFHSTGCSR